MKALNKTKHVQVKYPRDTPRISRQRKWFDRSQWRENPEMVSEGSRQIIDEAMHKARSTPDLQQSKLEGITNLMNVAGRAGLRKL